MRNQAREAGRLYRSTEVLPAEQAERLRVIYDSIHINDHDAEHVATEALSRVGASR